MSLLVEILGWANVALYVLVAAVAVREWRMRRQPAGLWAAVTFVALATVFVGGRVFPEDGDIGLVLGRLLVGILVLFPFLLYRFTAAFEPPATLPERLIGLLTAAMLIWTFVLPAFPQEGEPRPAWFVAYLIGFLVHWTLLTTVVAARLWTAGTRLPGVARSRMRVLAVAAVSITVALFVAAFSGGGDVQELVRALLAAGSALLFLLGLAPPELVRTVWRRPEQIHVREAIADLMGAVTAEDVAERVLEPMTRIVGARAAALWDAEGTRVGSRAQSGELLYEPAEPQGARFELVLPRAGEVEGHLAGAER